MPQPLAAACDLPMTSSDPFLAGYADCRFGQIHYRARHPAVAARLTPIVLLNPRSRSCLRLAPWLDHERPLFIVDIPAYGSSSPPKSPCSMQEVAECVVSFMDALGIGRPHVCGLHTGAKVAAALASHWPHRVRSLMVCGKSHSLVPDQLQRNQAMRDQVAARPPDVALMSAESYCADDSQQAIGRSLVYDANFAFDLAGELGKTRCRVWVIEISSDDEDTLHGRQGEALAACAPRGSSIAIPERESMGVDLYVGAGIFARTLESVVTDSEATPE
jgi:pimeloyl-ACP methyl ester carboxylesterase